MKNSPTVRAAIAALAAALAAAASPSRAQAPATGSPISEIRFEGHEVFDPANPDESARIFRLADQVHVRTREAVIRRELLFKPGDPYDPALVAETERNLRRLPLFRKVAIEGVQTSSGTVVYVRTWDSWTLDVAAQFSRVGGANAAKLGLGDRNILGYGKAASVGYAKSGGSVTRSLEYQDPQFLGRRVNYRMSAQEGSDSRAYGLAVSRPFFASITRSQFSGGFDYAEGRTTVLERGIEPIGLARQRSYDANLTYGYAFAATPSLTRRLTVGLRHRRLEFTSVEDPAAAPWIPDAERHTDVQVTGEYQELAYIKQRRVQKLSKDEDVNLGLVVSPSLTYGPRWSVLGATGEETTPAVTISKGAGSGEPQFAVLKAGYSSTYFNGGDPMRLATAETQYYCHVGQVHTLATRVEFDQGWRLDAPHLLYLGDDNGLRGYHAKQLQGTRKFVFNAEDRVFLFQNLMKLVDGGAAAFFDTGSAWQPERRMSLADFKSSVGIGLRLAAARSADNNPVRIDLAHALNDNNFNSRWTVSIQAGHAFTLD